MERTPNEDSAEILSSKRSTSAATARQISDLLSETDQLRADLSALQLEKMRKEEDRARMCMRANSDVQPAATHLEATPHDAERTDAAVMFCQLLEAHMMRWHANLCHFPEFRLERHEDDAKMLEQFNAVQREHHEEMLRLAREWQHSYRPCEEHTPAVWEGDGSCVICEAHRIHAELSRLRAERDSALQTVKSAFLEGFDAADKCPGTPDEVGGLAAWDESEAKRTFRGGDTALQAQQTLESWREQDSILQEIASIVGDEHVTCSADVLTAVKAEIARLTADLSALKGKLETAEQERDAAIADKTRALLRGTVKGFSAGENADAKHWRKRAEAAEAEVAALKGAQAQKE